MVYQDSGHRVVVIVNRTIPFPRLANAIAHCCAGLADIIGDKGEFLDYPCPAESWQARISRWPVIVLEGKNSGQLARFSREALEQGLPMNCFTASMIGESAEQQIEQTREDSSPEYWAVAAFGESEALHPITKRFSLFKTKEVE